MRDVDVVYLCEHVARELDVACAVKHLAQTRHGTSVDVLPVQTSGHWAVKNLCPRVVAVPFSFRVDDSYTKDFLRRWPGVVVFNLAWEQLLYRAFAEEKMPADDFARRYVVHHAWGESHRQRLIECGVAPEQILVGGQPAYGLYLPPYRDRYPSREELARRHGLDPQRRWVLFPENYGWGFYPQLRIDSLLAGGMARETIDRLVGFCRDSVREALRWCATLARQHPVEVIVRPRPATLLGDFRDVLHDTLDDPPPHLHLIKEGSVREWILASHSVFSSYSTTLIEAAVAGKRPFMIAPIPLVEDLEAEWYTQVPTLRSEEDFVAAALDPEQAGIGDDLAGWAHKHLLANGDPIASLAGMLSRLAEPGFPRPPIPPRDVFPPRHRAWRVRPAPGDPPRVWLDAARHRARNRFRRLFRHKLGGREHAFFLAERRVPETLREWLDERDLFDSTEVDHLTGIWRRVLGEGSAVPGPRGAGH